MKKITITTDVLLEEGKYFKQIPCYIIFAVAGIGAFLICVIDTTSVKQMMIAALCTGILALLPFGYFLGIRKLLGVLKDVKKVKEGRFYILEQRCIDKQVVSNKDASNATQIIFGEDSGVWVNRKTARSIKVGDICYVFYLEGDEDPSMVFGEGKYQLDGVLKRKIRN